MKKLNRYFILPLSTSFFNTTQWISLSIKDFYRNRCILWAAALTYTTVFALIPLLAVTFSLFHAFGGLKELEEKNKRLIDFLDRNQIHEYGCRLHFMSNNKLVAIGKEAPCTCELGELLTDKGE